MCPPDQCVLSVTTPVELSHVSTRSVCAECNHSGTQYSATDRLFKTAGP